MGRAIYTLRYTRLCARVNFILRINEIFDDKKFETADVEYIEKEFNDIIMEDGYKSLFNFNKLKEFVKTVTSENS